MNNNRQTDTGRLITACYERLSKDDLQQGDSNSIVNQKIMLSRYVQEQGWNLASVRCDDGVSGTTFDRPGFNELLNDISSDKADSHHNQTPLHTAHRIIGSGYRK